MQNKEELINNLRERKEYLEYEWCRLGDLADRMGGVEHLEESDSRDAKDIMEAFTATWKAFKAVRRIIDRNK